MEALPSPQQLRYIIALSELHHFGRAANACSVTQSTLSAGILNLERQLNVSILDRTAGKRVVFTPLGQEIAEQARIALQGLETVREMVSFAHEPLSSTLKLGIIPTIAPYILSSLVKEIRKTYPKLTLTIQEDVTEGLMEKLFIGYLDLLIIAMPCSCGGADTYALYKDNFYLIVPENHELTKFDKVSLQQINPQEVILLQDGHCLRNQTIDMCRQSQTLKAVNDFSSNFLASSLDTVINMVEVGFGVALIPEMVIKSGLLDHKKVVVRSLEGGPAWRTIGLAWRRNSLRSAEFKQFEKVFHIFKH